MKFPTEVDVSFNNKGILSTYMWLWLTESNQTHPGDLVYEMFSSSVKGPEFHKYLKKAGRHISQKVVFITIEIKIIVQKP